MDERGLFQPVDEPLRLAMPDADVVYYERVGFRERSSSLLQRLVDETEWRNEPITLFGKTVPQPRLTAWHGDPGASYTYSGLLHEPQPWTETLSYLRDTVEALCDEHFNSVLLNLYRDRNDSMGLHADDEPELGPRPAIASLSLGATRTLYFSHRCNRQIANVRIPLADASLLLMRGTTQRFWKHGIRKQAADCGPRLNLTFRWVRHREPTGGT